MLSLLAFLSAAAAPSVVYKTTPGDAMSRNLSSLITGVGLATIPGILAVTAYATGRKAPTLAAVAAGSVAGLAILPAVGGPSIWNPRLAAWRGSTPALPPTQSPATASALTVPTSTQAAHASGLVDLGNPMSVQTGHHYRTHVELQPSDVLLASPAAIASLLGALGFSDVKAYGPGDVLPSNWPPETTAVRSALSYYAEGTWPGPAANLPRDPRIVTAWEQA